MDKYVGKRLDGRYEIREIIGVGGMAVVYKAYDAIEERIVAIKILKEEFVSNEEFVRRFKNESKAIAVLSHPNIVKVYDVSFGDLIQYIVMEYIEGITLKRYIESHGRVGWKDTVSIVMQILKALQHAHDKGIIHRDVKPQNIMIATDGTIKVTDFGIARFARSDHKTMTDKAIGSVHYISPEQARSEVTDEKADIYSMGVIMYEMLSGTLPFEADSAVIVAMMQLQNEAKPLREIDPTIPLGLAQITMNAMQKDVVRRYQTAAEMLCDLDSFRRDPSATFEHKYFIDNAPTKFVDTSNDGKDNANDELSKDKKKIHWVPIATGIIVGIAILVVVFLASSMFKSMNSTASGVPCPDFVGKTIKEIKKEYDIDKFTIVTEYREDSNYEVGEVINQKPSPGTEVKKKNEIKLVIAKEAAMLEIPDVTNNTASLARKALKEAGFFNFKTEEIYDDVVDEDKVVKTSPLAGSQVASDEEITIFISKGREIIYTTVPEVIGYDEESAKAMLESKKLKLGKVTSSDSSQPKGFVINQSISDRQVEVGTEVDIVISTGNSVEENKISVTVDLPSDCEFNDGFIYAEYNDIHHQSPQLSFIKDESYTFTVVSEDEVCDVTVKILDPEEINEYAYQKIRIDFSEKKPEAEVIKEYNEYPKVSE